MALFNKKSREEAKSGIQRNGYLNYGTYRLRIGKYIIGKSKNPATKNRVNSILEVEVVETLREDTAEYTYGGKTEANESQQPGDLATIIETMDVDGEGNVSGWGSKYALQRVMQFAAAMVGAEVEVFDDEDLEVLGGPNNPLKDVEFTCDYRQVKAPKGGLVKAYTYSNVVYPSDE